MHEFGHYTLRKVIDDTAHNKPEIVYRHLEAIFRYLAEAERTHTDKVKEHYEKAKTLMETTYI